MSAAWEPRQSAPLHASVPIFSSVSFQIPAILVGATTKYSHWILLRHLTCCKTGSIYCG